jgi:preprotein translocase subunit SecF
MELIKPGIRIDFVGKVRWALAFSLALIVISLGSLILKGGPRYGVDFKGGTDVQVKFSGPVQIEAIKESLRKIGIEDPVVQRFGEAGEREYLIKMEKVSEELQGLSSQVGEILESDFGTGSFEIRRVEMVGPKVGEDLRRKGFWAVTLSLLGMLAYIWWRFELRFGIGAIVALAHDVIITVGALSLTNKPIDLPIIAALLTVVGYSVNDTIIVCDRIRENLKKMVRKTVRHVINTSVNETLSRTILTSGTTLFVLIALFFLGGGVIHDFAFALLVGVLVGTYSSIYIASSVLVLWEDVARKRKRR